MDARLHLVFGFHDWVKTLHSVNLAQHLVEVEGPQCIVQHLEERAKEQQMREISLNYCVVPRPQRIVEYFG